MSKFKIILIQYTSVQYLEIICLFISTDLKKPLQSLKNDILRINMNIFLYDMLIILSIMLEPEQLT